MKKVFVLFLLFLVAGCAKIDEYQPVVRVGNRVVNVKDFRNKFYIHLLLNKIDEINEKTTNDFIEETITFELELSEAYAMHMDKDSVVLAESANKVKKLFPNYVMEHFVVPKVITDKDYEQRYYCKTTEIKAEQIYIPLTKDDGENQKNRALLDSLRNEIVRGADFGKLAQKFSKDMMSAGRGGNMGFVRWDDKHFDKDFYNTLFRLKKGELSPVIVTGTGMHLVRKIEERTLPALPFDMERRKMKREFFGEYAAELNQEYKEFIAKLKIKYPGELDEDNVNYFVNRAKAVRDSLEEIDVTLDNRESIEQFDSERVLMKYGNEAFTIKDFMTEVHFMFSKLDPNLLTFAKVARTVQTFVLRNRLMKYGYDKGLDNDKIYTNQLNQDIQKFIVDEYRTRVLKDSVTEEDQKAEYKANWQKYNKLEVPYHGLSIRQKLEIKKNIVDRREKEVLKKLREKYPVVVYRENLEFI